MQRLVLALMALAIVAILVGLLWRGVKGDETGTEVAVTSGAASRIAYALLLGVIGYVAFLGEG
jgi:uncharacterized membrane protein YedE/YeeE